MKLIHMKFIWSRSFLRSIALSASMLFATTAFAGPPLLCHPFDTAGAPSLEWGGPGWRDARADYDLERLVGATEALLTPQTPVIARMETLRRAAIYSSRKGEVASKLMAHLESRITMASASDVKALALFDAGYFAETLQGVLRLNDYNNIALGKIDAPALRAMLARNEGSISIAKALAMRPGDASMRFGAALVAASDQRQADYATHARIARAGASRDRLLALNVQQITP